MSKKIKVDENYKDDEESTLVMDEIEDSCCKKTDVPKVNRIFKGSPFYFYFKDIFESALKKITNCPQGNVNFTRKLL